MTEPNPHRRADPEAVALAQKILEDAHDAALSVLDEQGWPMISRIALQTDSAGVPLALLSGLALHSAALRRDAMAALLIDVVSSDETRGMALTRPRLSLQVRAEMVDESETDELRKAWRNRDPKAAVYLQLPDFRFWRLHIVRGMLNAGFGKASLLKSPDI